jgi:hypothetical protein
MGAEQVILLAGDMPAMTARIFRAGKTGPLVLTTVMGEHAYVPDEMSARMEWSGYVIPGDCCPWSREKKGVCL